MSNTPPQRTANMVHFPSQDASDPNALDVYLDTLRGDIDTNTTDIATNASDIVAIETGKQELWIPAGVFVQGGGATYSSNGMNDGAAFTPVWSFDDTALEFINYAWAPPKRWALGTITYRIYWSLEGTSTGNVEWNVELGSFSDGDAVTNTYANDITLDAGHGTDGYLNITAESDPITIAGSPADGDLVRVTVVRIATSGNDTATGDAHFIGLKLFWTPDAGSDT